MGPTIYDTGIHDIKKVWNVSTCLAMALGSAWQGRSACLCSCQRLCKGHAAVHYMFF